MGKLQKCMKSLDIADMWGVKLATAAFVLFLITVWPAAMNWVQSVHWGWFLGVAVIASLRPIGKYLKA